MPVHHHGARGAAHATGTAAVGRRTRIAAVACAVWLAATASVAHACLDTSAIVRLADDWQKERLVRGLPANLTLADGACTRDRFVAELQLRGYGPVVGYKAGLTNPAVQKRFGVDHPVRGTLLARMVGPAGGVPVHATGSRPIIEADLLVEVGDPGIMQARDHLDVLRGLSAIMPFIELPDVVMAENEPFTGATILAINVGARGGLYGKRLPVEATQAFADRLAGMQVVVSEHGKGEIARAPGRAILGHPLDAVLWLIRDLAASGVALRAGDLLSLGAFGPPLEPRSRQALEVRYVGLPGDPAVHVLFY